MALVGADTDQLRATAALFTQAADRLQESVRVLNGQVVNAGFWHGPDAQRFRSEWTGHSVSAINAAAQGLRSGAEALRRNADEQDNASRPDGGSGSSAAASRDSACYEQSARGLNDMWNEIRDIPGDSSGYRVQEVEGPDGQTRYVVYIAGTASQLFDVPSWFANQSGFNNVHAARGALDEHQVKQLEKLIPEGAEVMLVGYSQGGMDAQNIAMSGRLNVTQVVTFGSPVRSDLDVSAVHIHAKGDSVPGSAAGSPGPYSDSAIAAENNSAIFHGESENHRPQLFNGTNVHSNAYGDLSKSFDTEAGRDGTRAADAVDGLDKFRGNVRNETDLT